MKVLLGSRAYDTDKAPFRLEYKVGGYNCTLYRSTNRSWYAYLDIPHAAIPNMVVGWVDIPEISEFLAEHGPYIQGEAQDRLMKELGWQYE